jgi:hypothetical protein
MCAQTCKRKHAHMHQINGSRLSLSPSCVSFSLASQDGNQIADMQLAKAAVADWLDCLGEYECQPPIGHNEPLGAVVSTCMPRSAKPQVSGFKMIEMCVLLAILTHRPTCFLPHTTTCVQPCSSHLCLHANTHTHTHAHTP